MERGAFVTPSIVGLSQDKFVPVKLRSDEHEQLALSLGLSVLPSTVLVKPTGEVIDKWEGYGEPGEFLVYLETILEREAKNKKPDVALASYCPVSLVEKHKLIIGQDGVTAKHDGSIYKFVDQAAKTAFLASPEKYVPANHGECPVKQVDGGVFQAGQPRWGVLYKGHLYLCADQTERDQFIKNPVRYANVDLASRNKCPHCWGGSGKDGQQLAQAPGRASTAGNSAPVAPPRSNSILPPPSVLMEALLAPVMRIRR
jgi:YHS domain-containing protein